MSAKRVAVLLSIVLCTVGLAAGQTVWEPDPGIPVLGPGDPGRWDEGARMANTVLFDGTTFHLWFTGCDASCTVFAIGHATSIDGITWDPDPDPVLTRGEPGEWDDGWVGMAAVRYDGAEFHMWYGGFDGGVQQVGYAASLDGTHWDKDYPHNPVIEVGPPGAWDGWIVRPGTMIFEGDTYKMWYMAGEAPGVLRIGYAESVDRVNWNKHPTPVLDMNHSPGAWDMAAANPSVVVANSTYHMWYAGLRDFAYEQYRIGYAFSADGIHWTKHRDNPVIVTTDAFAMSCPVVFDGVTFHAWYSHQRPPNVSISYATSTCCAGLFGDDFETGDTSLWSATVP